MSRRAQVSRYIIVSTREKSDSCKFSGERVRIADYPFAKKYIPHAGNVHRPLQLFVFSFLLPLLLLPPLSHSLSPFRYPKSPDLAALSPSYHPPARRKPHYTTPEKIGSTSCAPNALRLTTMDRVLRHYVTGGSHYWPIRSGALSTRLSDFISYACMNGRSFSLSTIVRACARAQPVRNY